MKNKLIKKKTIMIHKNHTVFVERINKNRSNGYNVKINQNAEDRIGIILNAVAQLIQKLKIYQGFSIFVCNVSEVKTKIKVVILTQIKK